MYSKGIGVVNMEPNELSADGPDDIHTLINQDFFLGNFGENYLEGVLQPVETIGDDQHMATGNIPSREDYEGEYGFSINYDALSSGQNNWVYSQILNQVFIDINKILLIQFKTSPHFAFDGYLIRALPVYSSSDFVNEPVNRCTIHCAEDDPHRKAHIEPSICCCPDYKNVGHVIRARCPDAVYHYDPMSERHSVVVKVNRPHPGSNLISIPYLFACKTSCPRGMQRRAIQIVFTLENANGVVGRKVLAVKICSCPKRDKDKQEKDFFTAKERTRKRYLGLKDHENVPMKIVKVENPEIPLTTVPLNEEERLSEVNKCIKELQKLNEELKELQNKVSRKLNHLQELLEENSC